MKMLKMFLLNGHDKSQSCLSFDLLETMAKPHLPQSNSIDSSNCWNTPSEIKNFPEMTYQEVMSESGLKKWLMNIKRVGFVLVTGAPATPEATKEYYGENGIY